MIFNHNIKYKNIKDVNFILQTSYLVTVIFKF